MELKSDERKEMDKKITDFFKGSAFTFADPSTEEEMKRTATTLLPEPNQNVFRAPEDEDQADDEDLIQFEGDDSRAIDNSMGHNTPPGETLRNDPTAMADVDSTWLKNFKDKFEQESENFDQDYRRVDTSGVKSHRATTPADISSDLSTTKMFYQLPLTSDAKRMMLGNGLTTSVAERLWSRFSKTDRRKEVLSSIGTGTLRQPAEQLLALGTLVQLADDKESWVRQKIPLLVGTMVKEMEKVGTPLAAGEIRGRRTLHLYAPDNLQDNV